MSSAPTRLQAAYLKESLPNAKSLEETRVRKGDVVVSQRDLAMQAPVLSSALPLSRECAIVCECAPGRRRPGPSQEQVRTSSRRTRHGFARCGGLCESQAFL